jgi:hypothetical protein
MRTLDNGSWLFCAVKEYAFIEYYDTNGARHNVIYMTIPCRGTPTQLKRWQLFNPIGAVDKEAKGRAQKALPPCKRLGEH